ncbi:MAG TPA: ABC transporter permease, partial [Aquihabitans sp.]|nr:ABC transporter permease [Aquihabitans sp.]
VVAMGILALAREITGANQLTAEGTFRSALQLSLPIAMAGLGGLWAERAGVVNIGLEGMMVLGTWFGAYGAIAYGPWTGVLFGVVGGAVGGLLHAIATVSFGVDHIISGVAINLLGVGLTNFLTTTTSSWNNATRESPAIEDNVARVDLVPFLTDPLETLSGQGRFLLSDLARLLLALTTNVSLLVLLGLLLFPATWYVLWRTPIGLRLRSVGEDPEAADSLGVKVYGMKYLAVMMSGAFAGLGGVMLVYLFAEKFQSGQTGGRGFIGLAAMIFGNWRPGGLILGAGLFGFMDAMQSQVDRTAHALLVVAALLLAVMAVRALVMRAWRTAGILAVLAGLAWYWYQRTDELPREMIPYFPHITTLLVLVFAAQRLRMPAADGRIYRRSGR